MILHIGDFPQVRVSCECQYISIMHFGHGLRQERRLTNKRVYRNYFSCILIQKFRLIHRIGCAYGTVSMDYNIFDFSCKVLFGCKVPN